MKFNSEQIEKKLRSKKRNIATLKYQKKHPEIKKKHARKNYLKYREKRLLRNKKYYERFKYLNKHLFFTIIKDNKEMKISALYVFDKLNDDWKIKSIEWS